MRFNEKVLMFESCHHTSPTVRARNICEVEIVRGEDGDAIDLEVILDEGDPISCRVVFGGRVPLSFAGGVVTARRVEGDGPITVILYQE